MRTIDDLLDEIREKVYSEDFEGKEILNERSFAISLLFIWHMAYVLLNTPNNFELEDSIAKKSNEIMSIMKNLPNNYFKLSYPDTVKVVFNTYWKIHSTSECLNEDEYEVRTIKSQVEKMLDNTCQTLEKKGMTFTPVLKHLTSTPPDDEEGFTRLVASLIRFGDGDIASSLPSFLCSLLNLHSNDKYIGIAPSSPFCIHTSFLAYGKTRMQDAIVISSKPAATYMYMNLLHCYYGEIIDSEEYDIHGNQIKLSSNNHYSSILSDSYYDKRNKALFIAPEGNTETNNRAFFTSKFLFDAFEDIYSMLEEEGIGIIVSPSCYFSEDKNIGRVVDFINTKNCIDSIICLPSQYKGDTTSTLIFIMKKRSKEETATTHETQIIDIFDEEGNGHLYTSTPYAKFPYSITQNGKEYLKQATSTRGKQDDRIRYVSSVSKLNVFNRIVKNGNIMKEKNDCSISTLLDKLEDLIKEARDFLV